MTYYTTTEIYYYVTTAEHEIVSTVVIFLLKLYLPICTRIWPAYNAYTYFNE